VAPLTFRIIVINGELVSGDQQRFINAALPLEGAVVVLAGPGGSLVAGISIGDAIRLKNFRTVVLGSQVCASACALMWLAGTPRLLSANSRVGFHGAWREEAGGKVITSSGNALVGAYLTKLGLPYSAVAFLTRAAPDDMHWLTTQDANRLGIEVTQFDDQSSSPPPSTPNRPSNGAVAGISPAPPTSVGTREEPVIGPAIDLGRADDAGKVQQRLIDLSYLVGVPDGVWGLRSRNALRAFKQVMRLGEDDFWDLRSEQALFSRSATRNPNGSSIMSSAPITYARFSPPPGGRLHPLNLDQAQAIQSRLGLLGFYRSVGDGNWGLGSRNAVREFKLINGLPFETYGTLRPKLLCLLLLRKRPLDLFSANGQPTLECARATSLTLASWILLATDSGAGLLNVGWATGIRERSGEALPFAKMLRLRRAPLFL
jgi:peptidoglycan hydrolase-like protein with peptidoglycan-binding domain